MFYAPESTFFLWKKCSTHQKAHFSYEKNVLCAQKHIFPMKKCSMRPKAHFSYEKNVLCAKKHTFLMKKCWLPSFLHGNFEIWYREHTGNGESCCRRESLFNLGQERFGRKILPCFTEGSTSRYSETCNVILNRVEFVIFNAENFLAAPEFRLWCNVCFFLCVFRIPLTI